MGNINLLPKNIKDDIIQSKANKKALRHLLKSIFWILAAGAIIAICWFYYTVQINGISDLIEKRNMSINRYQDIESKSQNISERLETISRIDKQLNNWSPLITELQNIMPNGVYLSSVKINSDTKNRSEITGFAETKSTVASLRNLLEASEKFEFVDIEQSTTSEDSVTKKEMENFILSFALAKGALDE